MSELLGPQRIIIIGAPYVDLPGRNTLNTWTTEAKDDDNRGMTYFANTIAEETLCLTIRRGPPLQP